MTEIIPEPSDEALFRAWQAGDPEGGAGICIRYADFITRCAVIAANKPGHDSTRLERDDLLQEGAQSVLRRAQTSNPEKSFERYHSGGVVRDITRASRSHGGAIELSVAEQSLFAKYWEEEDRRLHEGEPPLTSAEIADLLKLPNAIRGDEREFAHKLPPTAQDFCRAVALTRAESIETLFGTASELPASATSLTAEDVWNPQTEEEAMKRQTRLLVHELVDEAFATDQFVPINLWDTIMVREKYKAVITLFFGLDGGGRRTLHEIASTLGVAVDRVKALNAQAHQRLKAYARETPRFEQAFTEYGGDNPHTNIA